MSHAATSIPSIDSRRISHGKYESNLEHASLKATKEVLNKTKNDEYHTVLVTELLNENTLLVWAQNMNNPHGSVIYSRVYLIALGDDGL